MHNDMQTPPLKTGEIKSRDVQCSETNEEIIFRFYIF